MNPTFIIAIEGKSASGKTTLAAELAAFFGGKATVIHMDDFFLPSKLRTAERLATPGGNIHHERFAQEILPNIKGSAPFSYKIFDCAANDFAGIREVPPHPIRIVEGAYSCHPVFGDYMDLRVFTGISRKEQISRIRTRNGEEKLKDFIEKWIPMEERYFEFNQIKQKADIAFS